MASRGKQMVLLATNLRNQTLKTSVDIDNTDSSQSVVESSFPPKQSVEDSHESCSQQATRVDSNDSNNELLYSTNNVSGTFDEVPSVATDATMSKCQIVGDSISPLGESNLTSLRESSTSGSSSSDESHSSSDESGSSSEDCEDLLYDKSYIPLNDDNDSDSEHENDPNLINIPPSVENNASKSVTDNAMESPPKKGLKRKRNEGLWKRNVLKKARNSGKAYETHTYNKKIRKERKIKSACSESCKLKCSSKFTEEGRLKIFSEFWALGDLEKQRQFISNSMQPVQPKYRYIRIGGTRNPRQNNNAFYFNNNNTRVHVCKLFFKNTLDINDRPIRTVLAKQNKVADVLLEEDQRGKHGMQKKVDERMRNGIVKFIQNIPKIESHYLRANTTRQFIDGSKTIAQLHHDYVTECKTQNIPYGNYTLFYRIFTKDFNISFFVPKKDLCDICNAYDNSNDQEKDQLKESYEEHLNEKILSRVEKQKDKENSNAIVAVYDLQGVVPLPKGDVSVFYYKSKLNVFNFTIYNLGTNQCQCFVWDESNGHRGVNELGTCVLKYLKNVIPTDSNTRKDIIFYSDNCAGQQKNKFMVALYLYAIREIDNIASITHKFLIKGHTQNEGDSAHSLIERQMKRQLKGGPMYTPEAFVSVIRSARKTGEPFRVTEMSYEDFLDIKSLNTDIGPINLSALKLSEVKILKVTKEKSNSVFCKTSFAEDEYKEVIVIKRKKIPNNIDIRPAFYSKPCISEKKKEDLMELVKKKQIPANYKYFFENL